MDSSGPFRSARPKRWLVARIVAAGFALIGGGGAPAADAPFPPTQQAGPMPIADQDLPEGDLAPLPDAGAPAPDQPLPLESIPPPASPLPVEPYVEEAVPPLEEPVEQPRGGGFPGGGEARFSAAGPVGLQASSADGTVSVLVPSAPSTLPPGGSAGALPASSLPPTPPFGAALVPPQPPPTGVPAAPPPLRPASSQAAELIGRGLELPFPLVSGSPTAEIAPPRPLPLLEALERSGDRTRRLWITQSYWKLAAAAARVRFAAEAEERLSLVAPGGSPDDLVLLDLATAAARGECASAGVELVAAQQEIVDLVRLPVTDPPPWPVDRPLTTAYQTHFDTIFAGRPATGRVRAIHRQLPLEVAAVVSRAEAVLAAQRRFAAMEALHARGSKPIGVVLSAHDAMTEQSEAFVAAVRGYNLDIAEYVMAVADLSVPDERFAAMLIGQPTPWRQPMAPAPVFTGQDRVVPVAGQSFLPSLPGGTGASPGAPNRFVPAPNGPPAVGGVPAVGPPFGG